MLPLAQHLKHKPVTTMVKLEEWGMLMLLSLLPLYIQQIICGVKTAWLSGKAFV